MKQGLFCLFITAILFGLSCNKDWLEEKFNKLQAVPNTLKDFQAMLDFSSRMNNNVVALGEIAADGHYLTDASWFSATSNEARNAYTWSNNFGYGNLASWNNTYNRIFYTNIILDGLSNLSPSTLEEEAEWRNIKGQALFSRAEAFWSLAQLYAQPYDDSTAAFELGIPLRLTSDVTEKSIRSTVKATFEQILNDTKSAGILLPEVPLVKTRSGKAAAYGLLSRVYLAMRYYDSSLYYSDRCLKIQNSLIKFSELSTGASTLIGSAENFPSPLYNPEIIFFNRMPTSGISNFLTTNYLVDTTFFKSYSNNDLRRNRFFRKNSDGTITFKGNYNSSSAALFCGLATGEIFLNKAECLARKNNIVEALNILNTLLVTRYDETFQPLTASSVDETIGFVLQERRKELVLRNLRWSDLRRLNNGDFNKITIERIVDGDMYILEPNSYKYTFPIPEDVISLSGMPQSTGW